ncbi:sulfotransferase [Salinimicrobium sp. TIG7-5_MAKvit]|uniref:sulfotransferase family protein n=1 Tax=Salinimicrobium sp. TIG7-5_MAKvit TaxID=3121289 RepID=UPI003C6DC2A3
MNNIPSFFIMSNPRSGSSLLRVICEAHSEVTVPPECGFIEWWYNKYKDWRIEDIKTTRFNEFCIDLASSRKFETWKFDFPAFVNLVNKCLPRDYSELSALVHITFGLQKNKNLKVWGDKNNYYIHHIGLLLKLYPNTKFIFIVRDGRDVAASYIALKKLNSKSPYVPNLPMGIADIAHQWNYNNIEIFKSLSILGKQRVLYLRYEDLILDLKNSCKSICLFLNVEFKPSMLEYFKQDLEPKETLDWKMKTLTKPDKLAIGKYKKELKREEIEVFNSIAKESLKRFKYEF